MASSITGSYKLFNAAIEFSGKLDNLHLVGEKTSALNGIVQFNPDCHFNEVEKVDLIVLPAFKSDLESIAEQNAEMISWIKSQYDSGAMVASICTGSFLLGATGLLTGKKCTTHWMFGDAFKGTFPDTNFQDHSIITEEDRIFTSGGAFSFLNLIVYLIDRFYGNEVAKLITGIYQVDFKRKSQLPFVVFNGQKDHNDEKVKIAQDLIECRFSEKLTIKDISDKTHLSERTLIRRFKKVTGNTPNQYLQRVRIEMAKTLLTETDKPILGIQHEVGYSNYKTFYEIFNRLLGVAPSTYRQNYSKTLVAKEEISAI